MRQGGISKTIIGLRREFEMVRRLMKNVVCLLCLVCLLLSGLIQGSMLSRKKEQKHLDTENRRCKIYS